MGQCCSLSRHHEDWTMRESIKSSTSFHNQMGETEAETMLREHGGDCFLTRCSEAEGVFMLSVVVSGEDGHESKFEEYEIITHSYQFKIQGRKEVFDSIDNLLEFYQKNPISQKTTSIGELLERPSKYQNVEQSKSIIDSPSYHCSMNKMEAKAQLRKNGGNCYLTRYDDAMEAYMLSVIRKNIFAEFQMDEKEFKIVGKELVFQNISGMLRFYELNPISKEIKRIGKKCLQRGSQYSSIATEVPPSIILIAFEREPSYHGEMRKWDAIRILEKYGGDCYLTRFSPINDNYVLTVARKGRFDTFTFKINNTESRIISIEIFGSGVQFDDLRKLLQYYRKKSINRTFNGIGDYVQSPNYKPPDDSENETDVHDGIVLYNPGAPVEVGEVTILKAGTASPPISPASLPLTQLQSSQVTGLQHDNSLNLLTILTELGSISQELESLALVLRVEMEDIKTDHLYSVQKRKEEVIKKWLQIGGNSLSWETLCVALRNILVRRPDVADTIQNKYCYTS